MSADDENRFRPKRVRIRFDASKMLKVRSGDDCGACCRSTLALTVRPLPAQCSYGAAGLSSRSNAKS